MTSSEEQIPITALTIPVPDRAAALYAREDRSWDDGGPESAIVCGWTSADGICDEQAAYSVRLPDATVHPSDRRCVTPWVALCGPHTHYARTYWSDIVRVRDVRRPDEQLD